MAVTGILAFALVLVFLLTITIVYRSMAKYHPPESEPELSLQGVSATVQSQTASSMAPLLHDTAQSSSSASSTTEGRSQNECLMSTIDKNNYDRIKRVHLVVLVHGFIGCPQDLAYVRYALERQAAQALRENSNDGEHFIIHNCVANNGKTWDGVQAGAARISEEIRQVLNSIQDQFEGIEEITYSTLGYSLGGIYNRAALPTVLGNDQDPKIKLKITPKVFCTLATPHLGSQGHTYISLPRFLERLVGKVSQTSHDLFRHNNLLDDMVNDPRFVQPLLRFKKRIAYANTHAMDVMVPTSTAAFLSKTSSSIHYYKASHQHACMSMVVETPANHSLLLSEGQSSRYKNELVMSQKLDAMGWTKVFADFLHPSKPQAVSSHHQQQDGQSEETLTSAQLLSMFGSPKKRLFLPMGHDLVAVNSKNVLYSYVMQRGRPLVDQLAKDLIDDILLLEETAESTTIVR